MGFLLLVPFLLIRFGLLALLDKNAVGRAAHFAPLLKNEKPAYWLYQFSTLAIFVSMLFLEIKLEPSFLLYWGALLLVLGIIFLIVSIVNFAHPSKNGMNQSGLYRFSRNPMYVAYFVYFAACIMLTQSWVLLIFVLVFAITSHWIILSEERWCAEKFGDAYLQYMQKTKRYL